MPPPSSGPGEWQRSSDIEPSTPEPCTTLVGPSGSTVSLSPSHSLPAPHTVHRTWLIEEERLSILDASTGVHRPWRVGDFDTFRDASALTALLRQVWVSVDNMPNSTLPRPRWPTPDGDDPQAATTYAMGGPGGNKLPAKLRKWSKCGKWRAPQKACPPCWSSQVPPVVYGTAPILQAAAWKERKTDTYLLTLREDGSHGLDLSFVTHIFIVNPLEDEARLSQVVARAHRMGATAPVVVEPIVLWDD